MKTEPQNSIQQRMREILNKLKSFGAEHSTGVDFQEYSLSLDRLDKHISQLLSKQNKDQEEKKETNKEFKSKTNQLKQLKKDFDNYKKDKQISDSEYQHQIANQKTTIADLKRKLQIAKDSKQFHQYQKLKDQKLHLQKLISKQEAQIFSLSEQKKKMVSMTEFDSVQTELTQIKRSYSEMSNWERKYKVLSMENKQIITQLETSRLTNKHLQQIIQNQKEQLKNETEIISCLLDEDENVSLNSSQTCEGATDYQMEDIEFQKSKKDKKSKKHRHKYKSRSKIQIIQQEPEIVQTQTEQIPRCVQLNESEVRNVKSFSIVMFILAGVLAIPVPGWNC